MRVDSGKPSRYGPIPVARPQEVIAIRPSEVTIDGDVSLYQPRTHKTAHLDRDKAIVLDPKAQEILSPWLVPAPESYEGQRLRLELVSLRAEYQAQREVLQLAENATGNRAFVTGYELIQDPLTGTISSLSIWPLAEELLVPITDRVAFAREGGKHREVEVVAEASWDQLQPGVGDFLIQTDHYPPRYRFKLPDLPA
jgi:hypothetical protein